MKARTEIDGTVSLIMADGRKFTVTETDGAFTMESMASELLIHPISRSKIEIDTPIT